MILELQRTDGVGHALNGILQWMGKVIHRIDAPFITRIVMNQMGDAVQDRIPHIDIRGCHIDLCPEHHGAVRILPVLHFLEEPQVLFHRAVAVRIIFSRFRKSSPVFADLVRIQVAHISQTLTDQQQCLLIHRIKIVRCKETAVAEISAEPFDIRFDRLDKFHFFFRGIGIVKTEIEEASVFLGQARVQDDRFCVADVQISVRLRREPCAHPVISPLRQVAVNNRFNKIS